MQKISAKKGLFALSPVAVLLLIYLAGSLVVGDFYKIPISFAFCIASVYAVLVTRGTPFMERVQSFSRGAANHRILYMVWIFILAGISDTIKNAWIILGILMFSPYTTISMP